jgi:hypothetical protein
LVPENGFAEFCGLHAQQAPLFSGCETVADFYNSAAGYNTRNMDMEAKGIRNQTPRRKGPNPQRPPATVFSLETIQTERKRFECMLNENRNGRFIKITEEVGGRRDTIIMPIEALESLRAILERMSKTAKELPEFTGPEPETVS